MGKRFDDLSKAFATGVSRRQALMGALGGAGAAVAAAVLPGRGALADDDSARRCASFCATYCGDPYYFTNRPAANGGMQTDPCTDQCIAEASMGQGACFKVNGAPMYKHGCHCPDNSSCPQSCPPNQVCCNGRCCKPDLCYQAMSDQGKQRFVNGTPFNTNGNICIGCPPPK